MKKPALGGLGVKYSFQIAGSAMRHITVPAPVDLSENPMSAPKPPSSQFTIVWSIITP